MVQTPLGLNIPRAFSAARALVANPDDLPQVFTIIESLSMGTLPRVTKRWNTSESGRRLLAQQPDIVDRLAGHFAITPEHERVMMRNPGGDALDAALAALGAYLRWETLDHRAIAHHPRFSREGYVYA